MRPEPRQAIKVKSNESSGRLAAILTLHHPSSATRLTNRVFKTGRPNSMMITADPNFEASVRVRGRAFKGPSSHGAMTRRQFLPIACASAWASEAASVLVHEHVLVDFVGADKIRPGRYDRDEVFRVAQAKAPRLRRDQGVERLLDCTPNFLGARSGPCWPACPMLRATRDLVKYRLCMARRITSLYPPFAQDGKAEQLAKRWIAETREAWRPRFIKIGVNRGPLDELDRKLVRAAAITSRETGLTIASHTGDGVAALEQLEIISAERVTPAKFVWVHAQTEKNQGRARARSSRWGMGGIRWDRAEGHRTSPASAFIFCFRKGCERRILISQDSGWYHVGEPGGGEFRGYTYLYTDFLVRLDPEQSSLF